MKLFAITLLLLAASAAPAQSDISKVIADIRAALDKDDAETAITLGEAAVAKDTTSSELWRLLGEAYGRKAETASIFSQLGLAKKSRTAFERAVELDPRNVDARADLADYYLEAPGIAGGSMAKSEEQAQEVLKLDGPRGHVLRGNIRARGKDPAGAEVEYKRALEGDPNGVRCVLALAGFYVDQKRWAEAISLWQKRLDTDTSDMLPHYYLARIALFSGSGLEKGVSHLKAYLAVPALPDRPTWADAHWRLGLLYEKLGRKDDAKAELRAALKLEPKHAEAKKDLKRIGD